MNMYAKDVYPGQAVLGAADGARLEKLQQFYLSNGFIQKATPVGELFTNEFVT
jgi:NitT/TauT family transport system substrate-binding protein